MTNFHIAVDGLPQPAVGAADPPRWAAGMLRAALIRAGHVCVDEASAQVVVRAQMGNCATATVWARRTRRELPTAPDGFLLAPLPLRGKRELLAWGVGSRGLVYALLELADRADHCAAGEDPLSLDEPLLLAPVEGLRGVSRCISSEVEDRGWLHDREGWRRYLDMLATNRFNRVALTFGMTYNHPFDDEFLSDVYCHFAYPFLVAPEGYDVHASGLADSEREDNLDLLRFVGQEAARRGLDFQLAVWTHGGDFGAPGRTNYTITGITPENHAGYCRDALCAILRAVPQITGVTLRVHIESGTPEGSHDFWRTVFDGVARAGRPIGIDLHAKGVDPQLIDIAIATGMPVNLSVKYLAEHLGLPYHQASIRQFEMPPPQPIERKWGFSEGSRRFVRYSYGDLLTENRRYSVSFRIWPGTQRVLLWGDPVFAAAYGMQAAFCGAAGVELCEPLSYKGRMGSSVPGGRHNYLQTALVQKHDWLKYDYQYRVWGQCGHDAAAPRDGWMRFLRRHCGAAAESCASALAQASRVLPLVTLAHGPSASNHSYWPEIYDNLSIVYSGGRWPYGHDMTGPARFGTTPSFDPQLFANPAEFAAELLAGTRSRRFTPLDVASWLDGMAAVATAALDEARGSADASRPEVRRITTDTAILAAIARFFAAKFRSACDWELYLLCHEPRFRERAAVAYRQATDAWRAAVRESDGIYQDDISYGPHQWLRGSWKTRLPAILRDVADMQSWSSHYTVLPSVDPQAIARAHNALEHWMPVASRAVDCEAPPSFVPGKAVRIVFRGDGTIGQGVTLHYRHVNQAQAWHSVVMKRANGAFTATIAAAYSRSDYALMYYFSWLEGDRVVMAPGLSEDLSSQPYMVIRHSQRSMPIARVLDGISPSIAES